jgi:glycosyltransferase 2 family protein
VEALGRFGWPSPRALAHTRAASAMRDRASAKETSQRAGAAQQPYTEPSDRDKWDLVIPCVSLVVLVVSLLAARADLTSAEVQIFRAVNELPQGLNTVVWPFMQYGTFVTIPALALIALLLRRFRLAIAIALAGVGVYLLALVVKQIVERGRPSALLTGVEGREVFGADSLGFPSGHAAVASALTVVVAAHLPVRWTIVAIVLGVLVVFGRIYVGAHLPLDVIGGAALGAVVGSTVNLIVRARPKTLDTSP